MYYIKIKPGSNTHVISSARNHNSTFTAPTYPHHSQFKSIFRNFVLSIRRSVVGKKQYDHSSLKPIYLLPFTPGSCRMSNCTNGEVKVQFGAIW